MCLNLYGHAADPLPQIQIVRALIQKDATAFSTPGCTPSTRIIIRLRTIPVCNNPVRTPDRAIFAALHKLTHLSINVVCSLIEHHAKNHIGFLCTAIHLTNLLCIHARRLLNHYMETLFHRSNRIFRMVIMRNSHNNCINHIVRRIFN